MKDLHVTQRQNCHTLSKLEFITQDSGESNLALAHH